jgi:hypothetical protein
LKKILQTSPKINKISYFHIGYMGVLCGEISPIGNQKKGGGGGGGAYDLYKGLFWEKFPQSHHISRGTKKKLKYFTIFRP